jgi:hypothetical protein
MAPTQLTALMGGAVGTVGTVGAAMPSAAAGPGGADTAAVMSAGAALQGRDSMLAMAANPLIMPNGAAVTGQMSTTADGKPATITSLGVPGETACTHAQGARLTDMATPDSTCRASDSSMSSSWLWCSAGQFCHSSMSSSWLWCSAGQFCHRAPCKHATYEAASAASD